MHTSDRIFVAGHKGLVGSAIVRILREKGYENVFYIPHRDLDLRDEERTLEFFKKTKTRLHFLGRGKVVVLKIISIILFSFLKIT